VGEREEPPERFRTTVERSPAGIVEFAPDGRWLMANPRFCDLLGYRCDDLLRQHVQDITHPDDREGDLALIRRALAGEGDEFHRDKRYLHRNGSPVAVSESVSLVRDSRGAPDYFIAVVSPALRESEQTLRTVLETLPVGVWFTDGAGNIVYGNPAGRRVWGGEALVGVEDYGEYKGWWADTGRRIAPQEWALARALHGEVSLNELIDIETFDGERKRVFNSALPLRDELGEIRGALVLVEDITIRYRAEVEMIATAQRLASVVNAAADAIVNLDGGGRIESFNRAAEQMFGYVRDQILGEPVDRLMTLPWDQEHLPEANFDLKRLAATLSTFETTARRSDGTLFPVELSVSFIEHLDSFTCIIRDITQRKAAEAAVRETERMAAVGTLAAGLAHDMANLVAPIRMGVSLLERLPLDEQAKAAVAIVSRCATSLVELTDSVRMAIRGDTAGSPQSLELPEWWDKARPLLQAALPPGVVIKGEFTGEVASVLANESQFTRAILNLVTNAGEAIGAEGDRGGRVVVWSHPGENAAEILIGVRDDGPGIPADAIERIFEPFFSTKPWSRSSGLGLPSVRAFAAACGGSVTIESEMGKGSNIILRLRAA
jgi:PAS domain S-box-containing protein